MNEKLSVPNTMDEILSLLQKRQRSLFVAQAALSGLFYGVILAAAFAAIGLLSGAAWMSLSPWRVLALMPMGMAVGAMVGLVRRVDALRLARALDLVASSQDRFASALQLKNHHRADRAKLVESDAMNAVQNVDPRTALVFRIPRKLKFIPLPALLLATLLWLAPGQRTDADTVIEPEVTPDQWAELHKEFQQELAKLPDPKTPQERELADQLKKLADKLEKSPDKKDVLEQIARLKTELEKRRNSLPGKSLSMRKAANSIRSSSALKSFADQLKQGNYKKAANALNELADKTRKDANAMSAEDFEAAGSDLDQMSSELSEHEELGHACKNCARAAESMNRDKFADSLDQFSKELKKNCDSLKECDSNCKAQSMLDELTRKMNECKNGKCCKDGQCNKPGCSSCNRFVKRNNKKGGLKAGWGSADKWDGGQMTKSEDQRNPIMTQTQQRGGRSTKFTVVSKDEKADSALTYREMYAEFVQKAEADLALESSPPAFREFLKRYFMAIKPQDDEPSAGKEKVDDEK